MILKRQLATFCCIAFGALLGYAAATGNFNPVQPAVASPAPAATPAESSVEATADVPPCCDEIDREELLALATFKRNAQEKSEAAGKKPNVLIIWGDHIGTWNISHNNRGMMGYSTPNIDRIARE